VACIFDLSSKDDEIKSGSDTPPTPHQRHPSCVFPKQLYDHNIPLTSILSNSCTNLCQHEVRPFKAPDRHSFQMELQLMCWSSSDQTTVLELVRSDYSAGIYLAPHIYLYLC
jgi:hypothetical protein